MKQRRREWNRTPRLWKTLQDTTRQRGPGEGRGERTERRMVNNRSEGNAPLTIQALRNALQATET